jgi:hypothetical protein
VNLVLLVFFHRSFDQCGKLTRRFYRFIALASFNDPSGDPPRKSFLAVFVNDSRDFKFGKPFKQLGSRFIRRMRRSSAYRAARRNEN